MSFPNSWRSKTGGCIAMLSPLTSKLWMDVTPEPDVRAEALHLFRLTSRTKAFQTFLLQRMAHAVPCFWTGLSGRKNTSAAVVSTRNLPVNQQNRLEKRKWRGQKMLKSAVSSGRALLSYSCLFITFPFEILRNQPYFNTFSAEREMWEGDFGRKSSAS